MLWNIVKNGINYRSTGAGFLPSTVSLGEQVFKMRDSVSVVHTWQSWQHVLQPRTPWHQPPVKHLIVPCVAQEHNHTCSSGSSKHGKPTSSPLHVLGFQRCRSLSQYRWKTSNYSNRHNFHEVRSIQETSCHPNPPCFSFYHFDRGHVYRFH